MSIHVQNISKTYGTQKALDSVSFAVTKGEIIGLLGPNGAGKSTLMKILTTYLSPSQGSATVNNFELGVANSSIQKSIGYLPENNPLYLEMYVKEYLAFNAAVYNVSKSRVSTVIAQTGLTPEAHKKIGELSKGYRQRVGLANALLHDPEVLILDEPTTGLDPNQLLEIRQLIKSLGQANEHTKKGKTVLLSTHIMQEVEAMCDRVIIINKGKIVLDKKMSELKEAKEQIVEVEFDYRVEKVALQRLAHVSRVENPVGFVYHIYFDTKEDMRSTVFDFAHDSGLKILQLHQKNTTLEKLFSDLTTQK